MWRKTNGIVIFVLADRTRPRDREVSLSVSDCRLAPVVGEGAPNVHARRMRYLITGSERPVVAAESGAASVSCGVLEWELVWVSVSDCLKRWL